MQRTRPPFEQSGNRGHNRGNDRGGDRGRGGFGDRGGRGGRNRRFGRQGGGGRDRGQRRDLPPSKYASPKPFDSKPREMAPYEPPPVDPNYEPIILPGESLAKYKNRVRPPALQSRIVAEAGTTPPNELQISGGESARENDFDTGLPDSLYAAPSSVIADEHPQCAQSPEPISSEAFIAGPKIVPQFAAPPLTPEPERSKAEC